MGLSTHALAELPGKDNCPRNITPMRLERSFFYGPVHVTPASFFGIVPALQCVVALVITVEIVA
jgi:hypothetical protein